MQQKCLELEGLEHSTHESSDETPGCNSQGVFSHFLSTLRDSFLKGIPAPKLAIEEIVPTESRWKRFNVMGENDQYEEGVVKIKLK